MLGKYINPKLTAWTEALRKRRRLREVQKLRSASGKALTFKKDRGARCSNCGASLSGPFCHLCGQKSADLRRPIWELIEEIFDGFFNLDSKILNTLAMLVTIPGGLTSRYMGGHRARYVPPIRLFLVAFFMFFAVIQLAGVAILDVSYLSEAEFKAKKEKEKKEGRSYKFSHDGKVLTQKGVVSIQQDPVNFLKELDAKDREEFLKKAKEADVDVEKILADFKQKNPGVYEAGKKFGPNKDIEFFSRLKVSMLTPINQQDRIPISKEDLDKIMTTNGDDKGWGDKLKAGLAKALADPTKMNSVLNDRAQWALLIVIPLFAFLLRLFHWRRDQRILEQLVFSLHYHAFIMVLMIFIVPIVPLFGGEAAFTVFSYGSVVYMFVSLKIGQRQGWIRTFFKFIILWPLYLMLLSSFLGYGLYTGLSDLS